MSIVIPSEGPLSRTEVEGSLNFAKRDSSTTLGMTNPVQSAFGETKQSK